MRQDAQVGARLRDADTGLQTSDRDQPARVGFQQRRPLPQLRLHRHGHPDVRDAQLRAREVARRHADDRERVPVEPQRFTEHGGISAEPALPKAIRENGNRRRARRGAFLWQESAAHRHVRFEHLKVIARREHGERGLRLGAADRDADVGKCSQAVERMIPVAIAKVFRVREHVRRPGDPAGVRAAHRLKYVDDAIRIFERQRPDAARVEQREYGGVEPDAERQGQDCGGREPGRLPQLTPREAQILNHVLQPCEARHLVADLFDARHVAEGPHRGVARLVRWHAASDAFLRFELQMGADFTIEIAVWLVLHTVMRGAASAPWRARACAILILPPRAACGPSASAGTASSRGRARSVPISR